MTEIADFEQVGSSQLGGELSLKECEVLASKMGISRLKDCEKLVAEGGVANTLYLLVEGNLSVFSLNEGKEEKVYTMVPGEVAGTRAFVDRTPRKATLAAEGGAVVYTLEPDDFESLLENHPAIVYKVMRSLFRITHTNLLRMNQEKNQLSNYINKTGGRY